LNAVATTAHCVREGYRSAIETVIGHPEYAVEEKRSSEAPVKLSWPSNAAEEPAMSKLLGRPDDRSGELARDRASRESDLDR
jgi:hypothetical protein